MKVEHKHNNMKTAETNKFMTTKEIVDELLTNDKKMMKEGKVVLMD